MDHDRIKGEAAAKALEFAEYMAKDAVRLLDAINDEDALRIQREESDDVNDDTMHDASCSRGEFMRGLRSAVYEFRKRAAKVPARSPIGRGADALVDLPWVMPGSSIE
jgi:hypothetical protein